MRTIKHFWDLWVTTPTPLKLLYFALACGLAAGLAAAGTTDPSTGQPEKFFAR
jgi:hypothetical protein